MPRELEEQQVDSVLVQLPQSLTITRPPLRHQSILRAEGACEDLSQATPLLCP